MVSSRGTWLSLSCGHSAGDRMCFRSPGVGAWLSYETADICRGGARAWSSTLASDRWAGHQPHWRDPLPGSLSPHTQQPKARRAS